MATEKVASILRKKSEFSEEDIASMTDVEAWAWVYGPDNPNRPVKKKKRKIEICFTGFHDSERSEWEAHADSCGLGVVKSVTKKLRYLCVGDNPGPSKTTRAAENGAAIITLEEYRNKFMA